MSGPDDWARALARDAWPDPSVKPAYCWRVGDVGPQGGHSLRRSSLLAGVGRSGTRGCFICVCNRRSSLCGGLLHRLDERAHVDGGGAAIAVDGDRLFMLACHCRVHGKDELVASRRCLSHLAWVVTCALRLPSPALRAGSSLGRSGVVGDAPEINRRRRQLKPYNSLAVAAD